MQEVHTRAGVLRSLAPPAGPLPRFPSRAERVVCLPMHRVAVALALLLVVWCSLPWADARRHSAGPGPALDAYPWPREWNPVALDPWGFVQRQCTSFAAWYLNAHGVPFAMRTRGPRGEALFLGAGQWDRGARSAGFPVETTPLVGSIAQWRAGESSPPVRVSSTLYPDLALTASGYGHVAVVAEVLPDGSVLVAEYDGGDRGFHLLHTRAPRYLWIGTSPGAGEPAGRADARLAMASD